MTATRTIAAPANVVTFITDDMMTAPDRFDDCRAVNLFAVVDTARKHAGRTPDAGIRTALVELLKSMTPDENGDIIQADVLAQAEEKEIASAATLRRIMAEAAAAAGVNVVVQRGPRGPMGPRDETVIRERLFREFMGELVTSHPDGIERAELENLLLGQNFKIAYIKAMASPIAKEIGLTINDRAKTGRKVDTFRIEVTRKAIAAADAAGLKSRDAIIRTVLRFWQAHQVDCAHTETAAYQVILAVRKMDAAEATPAPVAETSPAPVAEMAPF
jgi:hypothetical protein